MPVCSRKVPTRRSIAGTRPKSSSAFGRSSTASLRTSWSVVTTSSRNSRRRGHDARRVFESSKLLQLEEDRRQSLPGLVVQLPRESLPLQLLRPDDTAKRVARDALGEVDGDRRPGCECFCEAHVLVGEPHVAAFLVVGGDDADRPVAQHHRHEDAGPGAHLPACLLIHLDVVDERVDPFASPSLQDAPCLRRLALQRIPTELLRPFAVGGADDAGSRPATGRAIRTRRALHELAEPRGDEVEQAREVDLGGERVRDLVQRLELLQPRVAASYSRAFSIATAACDESRVISSSSSSVNGAPSAFSVKYRLP